MDEFEMKQATVELSNKIMYLSIRNDKDCEKVAEILRSIKAQRQSIREYWSEAKESSRNTYKAILAKEKEMLIVCDEAERALKEKILEYKKIEEKKQIATQIEAERLAKREVENLLNEAIISEESGDTSSAEMKMLQAEMVSSLTQKIDLPSQKIEGLGTQKRWKCRITDNELVPAFFNGIEIREVNLKKILEIRKKEPSIKIPGIEFYQDEIITVR